MVVGKLRGTMKVRANNSRGGATIIEFALAFPLVILILGGMFQFGFTFFVYNSLVSQVRSGTRYASVADFDQPNGTAFEQNVKNVVVYGIASPTASDKPLVPGLNISHVVIDSSNRDFSGRPRSIAISIWAFDVPTIWTTFQLNNKPKSFFVYLGQVT